MMLSPETLFFGLFVAVLFYLGYRMTRFGGFRGAMFGARIERTVGEVRGRSMGVMNVTLKVHALRRDEAEKRVGLEVVAKSFASYSMMPVSLSPSQAQELIALLQRVLETG